PGENREDNTLKLNTKYGTVMHFQFSNWTRFQLKQCWYRCREKVYGKPDNAINQKFAITLDDPNAFVKAIEPNWYPRKLPELEYYTVSQENNWHLKEIGALF
ncbi:MAG: hypothetical protein GWN01_02260, partial [Nitrosopumilaceae archaeon]|nr:hypothetical protein [Nitrosopumilaceae archaeon]NIU86131.1 hypothetical protein [Nitrosopumilaceae archaeon]NIV64936.1 hypothetical protein [Nitrosopumilaceae archaeon]NIX60398.1 hypothetical protein [Nitrosopumilaceae archaeon]